MMEMIYRSCSVTGRRNIPASHIKRVLKRLSQEVEKAIQDGYTVFYSGFAEGADILFAKAVLEKQSEYPSIRLIAVIPYGGRRRTLERNPETCALLDACCDIVVINQEYAPWVYAKRNQYLVDNAHRIIAVYDGRESGGTYNTIKMAIKAKREIRVIRIDKLDEETTDTPQYE